MSNHAELVRVLLVREVLADLLLDTLLLTC